MTRIFSIGILFLNLLSAFSFSQETDTTRQIAASGETIRLNLEWTSANHGQIQWQRSADGSVWTDIPSATIKYYRFNADTSAYYRAMVTSGTCNAFYSGITVITVANLKTVKIDSILDHEAVVTCTADLSNIAAAEWGVLIDTLAVPEYESSDRLTMSPANAGSFRFSGLIAGKKYYARVYVKLKDEYILKGNILQFRTLKVEWINRVTVTDSSATLWYKITGDTMQAKHGVFYSAGSSIPDTTSPGVSGVIDGTLCRANIQNLDDSVSYQVIPWIKTGDRYSIGEPLSFRTFTDYSEYPEDTTGISVRHKIAWKPVATAKLISQSGVYADYGRIKRIGNSDTLILVYHGGPNNQDWINIYVRRSFDNGSTWEDQHIVADISKYSTYWRFCTPEIIVLKNGWILLAYTANGKPETNENCYIHILTSRDRGESWQGPLLIQTGRSWEPSMVQLPGGEIELFYSSEAKWWPSGQDEYVQQEIHTIHSTDNGKTWSFPRTVAWYPGKRDGMPVPLLLQGNRGVAFTIETVNSATSPYIISRALDEGWTLTTSGFENGPYRWFSGYYSGHGGAPYIIQLPGGETVLSVHVYRGGDWHRNNYMQVMTGDKDARNFSNLTTPWGVLPVNESAVNNSLFLKNDTTIVAVSGRNFTDGHGGIYWLEGDILPVE